MLCGFTEGKRHVWESLNAFLSSPLFGSGKWRSGGMKRYLLISRVALSNFGRKFECILPLVESAKIGSMANMLQPFQQFVAFLKQKMTLVVI